MLYTPVMAGMWQQHELWDGTYTLGDLLDALEFLQVKSENEMRAHEAAELKRSAPAVSAPRMAGRK